MYLTSTTYMFLYNQSKHTTLTLKKNLARASMFGKDLWNPSAREIKHWPM